MRGNSILSVKEANGKCYMTYDPRCMVCFDEKRLDFWIEDSCTVSSFKVKSK